MSDAASEQVRKQIERQSPHRSGSGHLTLSPRADLYDLALIYGVAMFAFAVLGPMALIAFFVWVGLVAARFSRVYSLLLIGVWAAVVLSAVLFYRIDVLDGYLDAQAFGAAQAMRATRGERADWLGYIGALAPYALAVGVLLGLFAHAYPMLRALAAKYLHVGDYSQQSAIRSYGATETRAAVKKEDEHELVGGFAARGRLTAMPSLPKRGKSKALAGLVRAIHDGTAWFGRPTDKGRVYIASEEDRRTFSTKLEEFDITSASLSSTHLPEYTGWTGQGRWDQLLHGLFENAKQQRSDIFVMDTLTSWASWTFNSADHMSNCLARLKHYAVTYDMAVIVVLHDRKSGGEAIVSMLGSIAGAAAYDIIAGFDRDRASGVCTLTVSGRLGEWEANARLDGAQYVLIPDEDKGPEVETEREVKAPITAIPLLTAIRASDAPLLQAELAKIVEKQQPQVSRDLKKLVAMNLITYDGNGVPGDPYRYRTLQPGEQPKATSEGAAGAGRARKSPRTGRASTAARSVRSTSVQRRGGE